MSSGTEAIDRKQRIRDRYRGVDTSELEVIPAKIVEGIGESTSIRRVAAYVRVSTDNDEQTSSYELQKNYYTDYIKAQPGWEFVGIYDDEGISGTSLAHRKGMQQLIEDCKAGKIDLILTKSIARFARNIVDCLSVIETLKNLDPPVGVKFEADNIYTLDSNGRMILTILASVAEEESHSKSIIMNWSIDRRFSRGLFLTPALLGYDQDEDGNLVVNQDEAQTVKVIYYLYLNGFSLKDIAELLTDYERKTKLGNTEWNPGTIAGIIANERHCGDVLARKTFTPNFLTHKAKKNNNDRTQYRQRDHHEAIVSRDVFNAANHLRASRTYKKKNHPLPVLSVVDDGILRGYVPFDKDWTGFSAEEYREASESVMREKQSNTVEVRNRLDLTGYEVVRAQYFATLQNPAMTISNGRLRFNAACLKKFDDVEYVELLLNSIDRCIAIRPCEKSNPNAIRWGRLKEGRWCASTLGCRGLAKALFDIMEWDEDLKYRFRGQLVEQGSDKLMLFELDEPEMIKVEEIVLPPKEEESEGETVKKTIYIFPPEWAGTFGQPITSVAQIGILQQEHYAGNWDVLRPASEIKEMNIFTADGLNTLLHEAEEIMELYEQGCTIQEIMEQTGLKRASVHGYLPYTKGNYNLPELPLNAERRRAYRRRIAVCERLMQEINSPNAEECLWDAILAFAGYPFVTEKGLPLKYTVEGGEIFFNRKEKSVTRATVMRAFHQARTIQESEGCVSGPKKLGTFGASYLYPVFLRIGVCSKKSEIF